MRLRMTPAGLISWIRSTSSPTKTRAVSTSPASPAASCYCSSRNFVWIRDISGERLCRSLVTFDGFNEIDAFVAAHILNWLRPEGWKAFINVALATS
jgi:hypothetical protein